MIRRRKIIVVDDSEICRDVVRQTLEARGHEVIGLSSPIELGFALQQQRPDLVLVDVCMPALAGDKLTEMARRQRGHRCPIVLYSDRPEEELSALVRSSGADAYIPKRSGAELLARLVELFLQRSGA